jgi:hypothetical protein
MRTPAIRSYLRDGQSRLSVRKFALRLDRLGHVDDLPRGRGHPRPSRPRRPIYKAAGKYGAGPLDFIDSRLIIAFALPVDDLFSLVHSKAQ